MSESDSSDSEKMQTGADAQTDSPKLSGKKRSAAQQGDDSDAEDDLPLAQYGTRAIKPPKKHLPPVTVHTGTTSTRRILHPVHGKIVEDPANFVTSVDSVYVFFPSDSFTYSAASRPIAIAMCVF